MKKYMIMLSCLFILPVQGQENINYDEWMQYFADIYEDNETNDDLNNLLEDLSHIRENPYNIHTVTKEELEKLPFLSPLQIENLLYYIYKYAPILDIYELKNVEDLDMQTIIYLIPFIYVGTHKEKQETGFENLLKYSRQELMVRCNLTLQKKEGYKTVSQEEHKAHPNKYYLGDPFYLSFRYNLDLNKKIQFGISGEKDPGEPFRRKYPAGLDFYTYNITIKNIGNLEELHLGNYRLSFGLGLALNNNFSIGKTTDATALTSANNGIKRHLSTNENNYFSGIAGKIKYRDFSLHLFYSAREHDGNVDDKTILSFKTDGFHQTQNDLLKRNMINMQMLGKHLSWNNDNFTFGLTSLYYCFGGKKLDPDVRPYNLYYLRGTHHLNIGVNYLYRHKKFHIKGETAIDESGKIASITHFFVKPVSFFEGTISLRYYDKEYNAFFGKSFGENSSLQNETGFFSGCKIFFLKRWELSAYFDKFTFPWLKYNVDAPSSGNDISTLLKYQNNKLQMNLSYRFREKYKNKQEDNKNTISVLPYQQHKIKQQLNYRINKKLNFKSQFYLNTYSDKENFSYGWAIHQGFSFTNNQSTIQLDGNIAYFHTDDWNTRINIYEKNILYASGFSNYDNRGYRFYLVLKWQIFSPLTFYFKAGSTYYPDRESIGSGTEEIQGRVKTDLYGLIRYKF